MKKFSLNEKIPISSQLRALQVGDTATFPTERRSSVVAVISRLKKDLARSGWDCSYTDNEDFTVTVERLK